MYTAVKRLNAIAAFALSAAMALIAAVAAVSLLLSTSVMVTSVNVKHSSVRPIVDPFSGERQQAVDLSIDASVDLSDLFHWNTRYVYVSLVAHYQTPKKPVNQVVVFDRVVGRDSPRRLRLQNQRQKYLLTDPDFGLAGNNVTYRLHCHSVPHAGVLLASQWPGQSAQLPAS